MSESVATVEIADSPAPAGEPELTETELTETELTETELLVEEVSIDGMCGVY
jgi:mycofactocin precursor